MVAPSGPGQQRRGDVRARCAVPGQAQAAIAEGGRPLVSPGRGSRPYRGDGQARHRRRDRRQSRPRLRRPVVGRGSESRQRPGDVQPGGPRAAGDSTRSRGRGGLVGSRGRHGHAGALFARAVLAERDADSASYEATSRYEEAAKVGSRAAVRRLDELRSDPGSPPPTLVFDPTLLGERPTGPPPESKPPPKAGPSKASRKASPRQTRKA